MKFELEPYKYNNDLTAHGLRIKILTVVNHLTNSNRNRIGFTFWKHHYLEIFTLCEAILTENNSAVNSSLSDFITVLESELHILESTKNNPYNALLSLIDDDDKVYTNGEYFIDLVDRLRVYLEKLKPSTATIDDKIKMLDVDTKTKIRILNALGIIKHLNTGELKLSINKIAKIIIKLGITDKPITSVQSMLNKVNNGTDPTYTDEVSNFLMNNKINSNLD